MYNIKLAINSIHFVYSISGAVHRCFIFQMSLIFCQQNVRIHDVIIIIITQIKFRQKRRQLWARLDATNDFYEAPIPHLCIRNVK